jgi:hypothetical protein
MPPDAPPAVIEPAPVEPPAAPPAVAQEHDESPPPAPPVVAPAPPSPPPRPVCIEGLRDECASIFLLEIGGRGGTTTVSTLDVGLLVNEGHSHAWGLTFGGLSYEHPTVSPGSQREGSYVVKARFRQWLSDEAGLDFNIGGGPIGVVGEVGIEFRDVAALVVGVNTFPEENGYGVGANVGIRLGTEGIGAVLYVLAALADGKSH